MADREAEDELASFGAVELATPVPHARVFELFRAAPRQWMRAALSLGVPSAPSRPSLAPSFELGMAELVEDDRLRVALSWSPNQGLELFGRFLGAFIIEAEGQGARIRLEGMTYGGSPEHNRGLLEGVLRRVGRALEGL